MRIAIKTGAYNPRRYGRPWIAQVSAWPVGDRPELSFGRFIGEHGSAGEIEIEAQPGDILRSGQKDNRSRRPGGSESDWQIVNADGSLTDISAPEAREAWDERTTSNPLAGYSDEDILSEARRRGLVEGGVA